MSRPAFPFPSFATVTDDDWAHALRTARAQRNSISEKISAAISRTKKKKQKPKPTAKKK